MNHYRHQRKPILCYIPVFNLGVVPLQRQPTEIMSKLNCQLRIQLLYVCLGKLYRKHKKTA